MPGLLRLGRDASRLGIQILVVILSLRGELHGVIATRLGVFEDFSFVIADHDLFVVVIQNVAGIDWHLAATAGSVDHVLRHHGNRWCARANLR